MKAHVIYQRLYGLILVSSFICISDTLSLKGKRLDFHGRNDTFVSLAHTIPELSQLTACIDMMFMANSSSHWMAFSYISNNTLLGREYIDLGLAGNHQQLILYNLGRTFHINYHLTPFQWHTLCLLWDGVKGRLKLLLNRRRMLVIMDQPHTLTPGGTLVLGYFPKSGEIQVKSTAAHFTGSLYYFQLWDHILRNEEFTKCLHGNIVSWEEDVWILHKLIPTIDRRLHCFVSENMTIQETSTTVSQQIDLTTASKITGLNPQKTTHFTTVMSKSMPVFATNYTTISYLHTTIQPLVTMTTSSNLKPVIAKTATFTTDVSTSTAISLPSQSASILTTTDSMKITEHPYSGKTSTTKMVEIMTNETFHPTIATDFFSTYGITKNSIVSKSLATKSQSTVMKTTSLFSKNESISTSPWLKNKSTDIIALSTCKSRQEFLVSSIPRTRSESTEKDTSAKIVSIGTASAFPLESLLTSTAAPVDSAFSENQMTSPLATTDMELAFTVHSLMPMETIPALKTVETELTSTDFQDVSSPNMEKSISAFMPKETSSMDTYPMTSSQVTETQSGQIVVDIMSTHAPGITLAPTLAQTSVYPTEEGPVHTENTQTSDQPILALTSTSFSTSAATESSSTAVTYEAVHQISTNKTTWTSRPSQTLLTPVNTATMTSFMPNENFTLLSRGNVTNPDNSIMTTGVTPLEASIGSKTTASSDTTTSRYTTALLKLTSQWFGNFSSVSGNTAIANLSESELITLLLKTIPMSTAAANEHLSIPRETVVPSLDMSTLPDSKQSFSTKQSTFETTQSEANGMSTFGDITVLIPKSAATDTFYVTMTRKEITSCGFKGKSTISSVAEVSPSLAMMETTNESAQIGTASVPVSFFPDIKNLTTVLHNETSTTGVGLNWLSTTVLKTSPNHSYNGNTETFNLNHTYTSHYISESSEVNLGPLLTSESIQVFPELMSASNPRISGTSFSTTPTYMSAMPLSTGILPPQTSALHSSATPLHITHMVSLPVSVSTIISPVTSMMYDETKVTTSEPSSVTTSMLSGISTLSTATMTVSLAQPLNPTASKTSNTIPTNKDSLHTTSEAAVFPTTTAFMAVPSLTETLIPYLRSSTPMTTKVKSTVTNTSSDFVTASIHTLLCSKPSLDISTMSTIHINSTTSTPVDTLTNAVSYPSTFSGAGYIGLATGPTETLAVGETMHTHNSTNKLTTSVDAYIYESSTHFVNTPVPNQLVTGTSVPSDEEQVSHFLGKTPKTMEVTKIFPSKNSFISHYQTTTPLKMTDIESTNILSHQTHICHQYGSPSDGNSVAPPTSGNTHSADTLTSSNTVGIRISEISTSPEKTAFPSRVQTTNNILSPEKDIISTLSGYTHRTRETIMSSSSVTHPISYYQDISLVDVTTSMTTRISNPLLINTILSHLPSLKTHSDLTAVSFSTPGSCSSRTELPNANFTTVALSIPNSPTSLPGEPPIATLTPTYQASATSTILMLKSSKTTHSSGLKSPFIATSEPMSEKSSMPINDYVSLPIAVSSGTAARVGSFSTSLPSTNPRTTKTIQSSILDVMPGTYAGPPSTNAMASLLFPDSEIIEVSSKITNTPVFSSTESGFPSMETIPTTIMNGSGTSVVGTTASSLLSSKITEANSSTPKTMASTLPSTTQQSTKEDAATLGILTGVTNNFQATESNARGTVFLTTHSRTTIPKSVLTPTASDSLHTYPSLKITSLTTDPTTSSTSVNTPVLYPPWTQSRATPHSLTLPLHSPHSSRTEISLPISQLVQFPLLGTRSTPSIPQYLHTTSWHAHTVEDSQLPISTTMHVLTSNKVEAKTLLFIPGSLLTLITSQSIPHSRDATAMLPSSTSEILPTFGLSENTSLSVSSSALPTTLEDIKYTFEKTTTSVTPRTTLSSTPSIMSRATSSVMACILSSFPSGSSLTTVSNAPHVIDSSVGEVLESTFPASETIPTLPKYPLTNLATLSSGSGSTILTKITPISTLSSITSGSLTSLPIAIKPTGSSLYISSSPEAPSRTTVADKSRTMSELLSFVRMNISTPTTDHSLSIDALSLPIPTKASSWIRVPDISSLPILIPPKATLVPFINITTMTTTATGAVFPLMSTGVTHPSTEAVSLLIASFKTTWMDSTSFILSSEALTTPMTTESTVSFYNIDMSFSVFDEEPRVLSTSVINEFAKIWLNAIFQYSEFSLVNLVIQIKSRYLEQREGAGMTTISHVPYRCVCQAIIKAKSSLAPMDLISRIRNRIHGNSTHGNFTQDQLTLLIKSDYVVVKKLEPGKCNAEETPSKYKGTYKWLLTDPTETAQTRCIKNENGNATRICSINIQSGKSQWEKPRFKQCRLLQGLPEKIIDLANITISDENADDVAEHILSLVNESPPLDEEETKIIVSKVADISKCDEISLTLAQTILQIISAVSEKQIDSASSLPQVSNDILRIIEHTGHKMEFVGRTANLTVARLALAVLRVDHRFESLAFSIRSHEEVTAPEIFLGDVPLGRVLASIYLPKSLRERIPLNSLQTILFNFFGQTSLFKAKNISTALTTYVVSASISNMSIQNLADPVVITLQHIEGNWAHDQVYCAFWDFDKNHGLGGWNSSGCKVKETNINYTICQCNHLTHFGVLMDLSRSTVDAVNERILVIITYTGCGISSIFLGIAMLTYIAFHKLRKDYPSKILINLCAALLMLNLAFLMNSWMSSFQKVELCVTAAVALHYFLLVSLTWMGLEAVHMYFALVKVFNTYIPNYILKFGLAGWGIPAITVAIILSVRKDLYGILSPTTPFCWIKDDSVFYISVVAYFCLIFLVNLSMFCTVLAQLNSVKSQTQKTRRKMILHDLKGTISLTFLLGLTWGFAFFAWGPVRIFFMYLFAICNTLQGFLIFVFYCVMKESVREQWYVHLGFRWLQLDNYGVNIGYKHDRLRKTLQHKLLTSSLKSTATSSSFKSIGSAPGIPSEISFPNDIFDEDSFFSSLSCEVMPKSYIRRIIPEEIKANPVHKKKQSFSINLSRDSHQPSFV
uniref:Adhesion G-protein coupled receptor G4 n=1 Tax=Jaculus jaculus TaxID=51337 RepID=A0A8C5NW74_JACJA